MKDIPFIATEQIELCRILDHALVVETREVTSWAPCRPARAGQWEACSTWVQRTMVNPEWIASLKPHARDSFLASCATDRSGNAWIPKWCVPHTRETLNPSPSIFELDLFKGRIP